MEKLNIITAEMAEKNIEMLGQMFPNCLTEKKNDEGKIVKAIDFDKLRQELADSVVEGPEERYQFTWPDKRNAIRLANAPTTKTLRPCREESVDFDNTQNLYIEGDNLDVRKILRENFLGKIKMIYIDPPYNTGNDFVYNDDFSQTSSEYVADSGQFDSEGNRLVLNTESNGRFHTDWLNMMYPRLKVAKDLLSDDGLIFISLNDIECSNARKVCEEIYGANNFVADLIWANKEGGGSSDSKLFRIKNEHILCFARNIDNVEVKGVPISNADRYKGRDEYLSVRGPYYLQKLGMGSIQYSESLDYPIQTPDGSFVHPSDNNKGKKACWRWSRDKYEQNKASGFIEIKKDGMGVWTVYTKQYMNCDNEGNIIERTQRPMGIIDAFSSTQASKLLDSYGIPFNYSKPVELIEYIVNRISSSDGYIIDFFSGSATTAHAVMKLNSEDGGNRKYIMVQLPEVADEKSEAYKAGYKNICEIGKERIRRAGKKVKEEAGLHAQSLDVGFRVLKLDSANEKEVKRTPSEVPVEQGLFDAMLEDMVENIKEDRTPEDLLFQVLPMCNLPLSCKIETKEIDGKCVFVVEDGYLVACFDENIKEEVIISIAKMKPYYFVMRDSSLATDNVADNFDQIFNAYSKDTIRRIL